jgi:hypothetical protein
MRLSVIIKPFAGFAAKMAGIDHFTQGIGWPIIIFTQVPLRNFITFLIHIYRHGDGLTTPQTQRGNPAFQTAILEGVD